MSSFENKILKTSKNNDPKQCSVDFSNSKMAFHWADLFLNELFTLTETCPQHHGSDSNQSTDYVTMSLFFNFSMAQIQNVCYTIGIFN